MGPPRRCAVLALLLTLAVLLAVSVHSRSPGPKRNPPSRLAPRPSPSPAAFNASAAVAAEERRPIPADAAHVFHIIAHSHCDPGWLSTFEGYYMQDVRGILDSVLAALQRDPSRRFVWSETSYFARWWETLSPASRTAFRAVLQAGQFEFVNGGWSQHDEANPDPLSMVQQMSTGHQYLLHAFGVVPRVAWQIDPFGHSAVTPTLFSLMGFQALVINRVHHQIKDYFKEKRHMEFLWTGYAPSNWTSDRLCAVHPMPLTHPAARRRARAQGRRGDGERHGHADARAAHPLLSSSVSARLPRIISHD